MSDTVISVENVSKIYRLGEVGTGSLAHDVNRWWHRIRGKEDPYLKVGQLNDRTQSTRKSDGAKGSQEDWVYALKDINFEVKRGEVLGIIGRNGAGKSTLLKILSRVTSQTSGQIKIKGRIASLLEVGTGFHQELTGRENVFLNGAIHGMRKTEIESKIDEIIEFSGCARYIDTPVKRYSSGMYVRLAFSVAAHLDPETLIIDEVLAVGYASFQKLCQERMQKLAIEGATILIVSHNLDTITRLCSRAVLLHNGELAHDGTPAKALEKYNTNTKESSPRQQLSKLKRNGNGIAQFKEIEVLDKDGNNITKVNVGHPLQLRLTIEAHHELPDIGIAITLSTPANARIVSTWNRETGVRIDLSQGRNIITCDFENISLRPGHKLWIGLWLEHNGVVADNLDFVEEIEGGASEEETQQLSSDAMQGTIVVRNKWNLVKNPP